MADRSRTLAATGLAIILFAPVHAGAQFVYQKHEVAPLPAYCFARMERNSPQDYAHWYKVMGRTYDHIHHYCRGLIVTNRVLFNTAKKAQDRDFLLRSSLQEFDYVINAAPRNFVLLPEILTKKGENALKVGMVGPGLNALTDAIQLKPDYWPPYAALSDHYKRVGDVKKARELLEKALSFAPETHALRTRLAVLDGKSPPPPPPPRAKPTDEAKPSAEAKPPAAAPSSEETAQPAESK